MTNRVIIAGSRTCPEKDYELFERVYKILKNLQEDIEIVSGTARGADRFGEWFASECGFKVKRFPAEWDKYGKSAGYIRNKEMADYATHLIALWDGVSRGTSHMIKLAKEKGLKVRVVKI